MNNHAEELILLTNKNIQNSINTINDNVKRYEKTIRNLANENNLLREEHFKDKELQRMQNQLDVMKEDLKRGFTISEDEQNIIDAWWKKHSKETAVLDSEMIFHRIQYYKFMPSQVGTFKTVICSCGESCEFSEEI